MESNNLDSEFNAGITNRELAALITKYYEKLEALTIQLNSSSTQIKSRYLSANQVEIEYGINSKTLLNRSNLPADHHRHIPSVRLGAGGKKMFERKVLDRMLCGNFNETSKYTK